MGCTLLDVVRIWYKQWKVQRGCLEKFGLGRSQGDFSKGRSPKGKLYYLVYKFSRQTLRTFHCLLHFGLQKPKKMWLRVATWACLEKQWVQT